MRITALLVGFVVITACGDAAGPDGPYGPSNPYTAPVTCAASEEGFQRCNEGLRLEQCLSGNWMLSINCDALGQDCLATGTNEASCQPRNATGSCSAAEDGHKRCSGTVVEYCNGTTWSAVVDCATLEQSCTLSSPGVAVCQGGGTDACTASGEQRCSADVLQQCNGTAWVIQTDCGAAGEQCVVTGTGSACVRASARGVRCARERSSALYRRPPRGVQRHRLDRLEQLQQHRPDLPGERHHRLVSGCAHRLRLRRVERGTRDVARRCHQQLLRLHREYLGVAALRLSPGAILPG